MCTIKCVRSCISVGALLHVSTLKLKPRMRVLANMLFLKRKTQEGRHCVCIVCIYTVVFKLVNFVFQISTVFVLNSFPLFDIS
jgi:hypothetical protein